MLAMDELARCTRLAGDPRWRDRLARAVEDAEPNEMIQRVYQGSGRACRQFGAA
jgi:hypothetical protein